MVLENKQFEFSVIVAIYNVENYLEQAILSVINQPSFENSIQLILVNDGSKDNSEQICKKYQELYPNNIVYISKENGGVSSARNKGLEIAKGTYINFLDSDDYFSENAFQKVKEFFDKYGDKTDVVALNLINFENSEGSWVNGSYFTNTQLIDMRKEYNFMQCQVGASFIKAEAAKKYRFDTNVKIHEDSKFLYRIFANKPFCGTISDETYWHRIRKNGSSATQNINDKENIFNITENVFLDLIKFYTNEVKKIPKYLQIFIALEFNYYVIERMQQCELSKSEFEDLKKKISNVLKVVDKSTISGHFVLNESQKRDLLIIKRNINKLDYYYKKDLEKFYKDKNSIKTYIKKLLRFSKRVVKYIPKKIAYRVLAGTIARIDAVDQKIDAVKNESIQRCDYLNEKINAKDVEIKTEMNQRIETKGSEIQQKIDSIAININEIENKERNLYNDVKEEQRKQQMSIDEIYSELNYDKDEKVKYCLYFHNGSKNHGCEALVKSIIANIGASKEEILLNTFRKSEDVEYGINNDVKYIVEPSPKNLEEEMIFMGNTCFNKSDMGIERIKSHLDKNSIAISIGGDNYCYGEYVCDLLERYNRCFNDLGTKTALVGCSIEPEILKNKKVLRDLDTYSLILARESITYNALLDAGITKNTHLVPDSAFLLKMKECKLPHNYIEGKTIGINISPLVQDSNDGNNIIFKNYSNLIEYILQNTQYNIMLIPHVCWEKSNDLESLILLYNKYCYTGRVSLIEEHTCEELKWYISKCKMFIGARTHATIAAYSLSIPTLTIGYSVKSKGIAKDLFGTYDNYVIHIDNIQEEDRLINGFKWLENNYNDIKSQLDKILPEYKKNALDLKRYINLLEKTEHEKQLPVDKCTACTLCKNICPNKCIQMKEDENGFKYPEIDYTKCNHCGLCKKQCPQNDVYYEKEPKQYFAMKNKNIEERINSSSGGVFIAIAKAIIKDNGVVFGAAYDENLQVKHVKVEKIEDLKKLQKSKYVQSDLTDIYEQVKKVLNEGKKALFTGTPCQIQGLNKYLGKEYDNLVLVDIICHGVPSPKVLKLYKEYIEQKEGKKITNIDFRSKTIGWKSFSMQFEFSDNEKIETVYNKDSYMLGFLQNLTLRKSCYQCNAKSFKSGSDITLGDYWGIENVDKDFDDDKGCSLVTINTDKGMKEMNKIKDLFDTKQVLPSEAMQENYNPAITKSFKENKNRDKFFKELNQSDIEKNILENIY